MLRPDCNITLTQFRNGIKGQEFVLTSIADLNIESSWKNLTDKGELKFARKYEWLGKPLFEGNIPLIKRGDKISIQLAYNQRFNQTFNGYISQINTEVEVTVTIEDEMFLLKQKALAAKSYRSVDLKTLLADTIGNLVPYVATIDYTNLGKFTIQQGATPALVLEFLRKNSYGIQSFFRDGTLYVGAAYLYNYSATQTTSIQEIFEFQNNIIESSLEFRDSDSIQYFAKATCIFNVGAQKNQKRTVLVGDLAGAQKTFNYFGNFSTAELTAMATRDLALSKYSGYFGKFLAFGEPFVRHGDRAKIVDKKLPERNGVYLIKSVNYQFGWDGYFQEIELGPRIL